jgi:hypothetical protein
VARRQDHPGVHPVSGRDAAVGLQGVVDPQDAGGRPDAAGSRAVRRVELGSEVVRRGAGRRQGRPARSAPPLEGRQEQRAAWAGGTHQGEAQAVMEERV